jgi:cobalt-zinc-cadmium efflux system membrane fusion protein
VAFALPLSGLVLLAAATLVQRPEPTLASSLSESRPVQGTKAHTNRAERAVRAGLSSLAARIAFDDRKLATMSAPVQGRVLQVDVAVGDRVDEGALLLTLLSPDVAAANKQLTEAKRGRVAAERSFVRARWMQLNGTGTQLEYQAANSVLQEANAEERAARAVLAAFDISPGSDEYELKSPIAGVVVEQNVTVGTEVDTDRQQPLVTVADLSTLWVMTNVDESNLELVHLGAPARVRVPALPGQDSAGTITYVGDTIDPSTHSAVARIEIPNFDSRLRPGMLARVDIVESARNKR